MQIRSTHKAILFFLVLIAVTVHGAVVSRIVTFSDGSVLYASDLNTEFNNLVNNINNLDNDNLSVTANIAASKVSAAIDGSGITRDGGTGALSVNPDGTTIEINSDAIRVKDNSISNAKIRQGAALSVIGNSTNSTANVADITAGSDGDVLRRSGTSIGFGSLGAGTVGTTQIADGAVTPAKRSSLGQQISAASGNFSTSSTSYIDVTNLSVTITTTGRPVMVFAVDSSSIGSGHIANNGLVDVKILRDATTIYQTKLGMSTVILYSPCSAFSTIDTPSSGTYTYKMQTKVNGSTISYFTNCILVAYEL